MADAVTLDVALAPGRVPATVEEQRDIVFVVVDVIRATTTLCVLFARGRRRVYVASSVDQARQAAQEWHGPDRPILAGEVGGLAPPGFDYGNSPAELGRLDLAGRDVLFATTNGTRALHACAGGAAVLVGALRNATAVAHVAVDLACAPPGGPRAITVVCAGQDGRPADDDTLCAGVLVQRIIRELAAIGLTPATGEGARIALATADDGLRRGLHEALAETGAARSISAVGLAGDIDWCAAIDADTVVPAVSCRQRHGELLVLEPSTGVDPRPPA